MPDNILLSSLISPQLFCLKALGACGKLLYDFLSLWLKCYTLLSSLHQQQNLQCRVLHNTSFSSCTITVINLVAINRKYSFAHDVLFIFVPIARRKKGRGSRGREKEHRDNGEECFCPLRPFDVCSSLFLFPVNISHRRSRMEIISAEGCFLLHD